MFCGGFQAITEALSGPLELFDVVVVIGEENAVGRRLVVFKPLPSTRVEGARPVPKGGGIFVVFI